MVPVVPADGKLAKPAGRHGKQGAGGASRAAVRQAATAEAIAAHASSAFAEAAALRARAEEAAAAAMDALRFTGDAAFRPTAAAEPFSTELRRGIARVLDDVRAAEHLPAAIHAGLLGNQVDGAYPGTFGKGTVR